MKHITIFKKAPVLTGWAKQCAILTIGFLLFSRLASAGSLIATWAPNSEDDLAGYIVSYGTESGNYSEEVDVKNTNTFVATNLLDGQEYFFVVKAYDYSGNVSAASTEVSATVGGPSLVAMRDGQSIKLIWTAVTDADSYDIYRGFDPDFAPNSPIATVSATDNEFVDDFHFVNNEIETYYAVRAKDGATSIFDFPTVGAYNIDLSVGLNLVSLPLIPADLSIVMAIANKLTGGENSADADQVRIWNGEEYLVAWLYDGPASDFDGQWISSTTGLESDLILDPQGAFWVMIQKDHPEKELTITGRVPDQAEIAYDLRQGFNFVGCGYPVLVGLNETELYQDGVMKGGVGSGEADVISIWTGDGYERAWVVDGVSPDLDGTWMDETGKNETTIAFRPGAGYIIWIKRDNPQKVWTFPNPMVE